MYADDRRNPRRRNPDDGGYHDCVCRDCFEVAIGYVEYVLTVLSLDGLGIRAEHAGMDQDDLIATAPYPDVVEQAVEDAYNSTFDAEKLSSITAQALSSWIEDSPYHLTDVFAVRPAGPFCYGCKKAGCPDYQGFPDMSQECQADAYDE